MLAWLPFVTHIQLLLVLWLQLPFFRGAARILATVVRLLRGGKPCAPLDTNHSNGQLHPYAIPTLTLTLAEASLRTLY